MPITKYWIINRPGSKNRFLSLPESPLEDGSSFFGRYSGIPLLIFLDRGGKYVVLSK